MKPANARTSDLISAFGRMIERVSEAVLVIQGNGFQFANPRAEALLGFSQAELAASNLRPADLPPVLDLVLQRSAECLNTESHPHACTFKMVAKNGDARWVEMQSESFTWGDRPATLCFLKDVTEHRRIEEKLRRVVNSTSEGLIMLDRELRIREVNPALLSMTGYEPQELTGRRLDEIYEQGRVQIYSASRDHMSFEANLVTKSGLHLPALFNRSTLRDESGAALGYMIFLNDLTELNAVQEELVRAEQRYHNMYRNAVQGMFQSKLSGELIRVNPAYSRFLGYASTEEMLRLKAGAADLYYDPAERQDMIKALKRRGFLANYEVKLRRKDGTPVWGLANYRLNHEETVEPIIEGIMVDNTRQKRLEEELRREHRKMQRLSLLDNLTGLYNTRFLYQALDKIISERRSSEVPVSLIFMDMDDFKRVVDTHGHLNGSQALREVAQTIRSLIKKPGFGVAYGGDEFVVVLPGFEKNRAKSKVEAIRAKMRRTIYLTDSGLAVRLSASFGLASYPEDAQNIIGLLGLADKALFRVKQTGKGFIGTAG
jgi:diguanylate cyclase (GGDEF)-like protein/PAS domain S-box-containing protein